MIDEERREQRSEIRDRIVERAPRQRIAVAPVQRDCVAHEDRPQRNCRDEIWHAAHVDRERQQRHGKERHGI